MRIICYFAGFVVFGLVLFFAVGDVADPRRLDALGGWDWVVAVGLLVADVFVPVPTTVVITVMGQRYGPLVGGLIGLLGTFTAGVAAYGLARGLGPRFARWLLGDELDRAERFYASSGSFAVACSRWLPLIPEAVSCLAGLARMPFGRYAVALLCGAAPMSFAYAALATISENELVPLVVSVLLPVPIWYVAGRLLHLRTFGRGGEEEVGE